MSKLIFSFCLIFATMAIVRVNASYCSTYLEDLKQIDSFREYVNLIQSLPAAEQRVINNQLEQECNKLQEKVNGLSASQIRKVKRNQERAFELVREAMVQQGLDYETANGYIAISKRMMDDAIRRRNTHHYNNSSAPIEPIPSS